MRHYYVYYRIDLAHTREAFARVRELQHALRERTGIAGRLLRRTSDPTTWMEIYEAIESPEAFEAALIALVSEHRFDTVLAAGSQRHVERFVDFDEPSP